MAQRNRRTFNFEKAVREQVPVLFGLSGPSGCGKTLSALRVAKGVQDVVGGRMAFIDTEARRGLHYADYFDFDYTDFRAPFGSLDYLDAIEAAVGQGARIVVIDSLSHEHEGPGGLLDLHEQELDRLAGSDWQKRERVKMLAWQAPKAARRKLLSGIVQSGAHFVFCFRAKSTAKPVKGRNGKTEVVQQGFMPITGEEFPFEMTVNAILPPNCKGVPEWHPANPGEQMMCKLPKQFEEYLLGRKGPLDEEVGRHLAEWAKGGTAPKPQPAPSAEFASWLDEPLGYGKKVISGKPAKEHTWRWFSEGEPGGGRHSYLKAVIDKIDAEEDPHSTLVAFKEKALEVCGIIEDVPDEAGACMPGW